MESLLCQSHLSEHHWVLVKPWLPASPHACSEPAHPPPANTDAGPARLQERATLGKAWTFSPIALAWFCPRRTWLVSAGPSASVLCPRRALGHALMMGLRILGEVGLSHEGEEDAAEVICLRW